MKKFLILLSFMTALTSCTQDVDVWCCHGHSNTTTNGTETKGANLIVNVGDSKYGNSTRSVVADSQVTSTKDLQNVEIKLYSSLKGWNDTTTINYGSTRGYLFAESNLTTPYAVEWSYEKAIQDGKLTLTAKESTDKQYYSPVSVLFWGNYELAVNDSYLTSYAETDSAKNGWKIDEVSYTTRTVAISKNIQYATSVFKPIITVADSIQVYSDGSGKNVKKVAKDKFKFSVQYVYVHSSKSVQYGEDFKYTPSTELVAYKYPLKANGIFGKTENGDAFDSWENNYANLTILPTSQTEVQVVLVCYYMGDESFYVYNSKNKQYSSFGKGGTFYIYGKIKTSDTTIVTNDGNKLCPKNGSVGVFIPDVRTTANITIDNLATDTDGDGTNDPVVIDPDKSDIVPHMAAYTVNVEYGSMTTEWATSTIK